MLKRIAANDAARVGRVSAETDSGSAFFEDMVRCRDNAPLAEAIR